MKNGVQQVYYFHHLNNLLWVWGANGPRDIPKDEVDAYKDFLSGLKISCNHNYSCKLQREIDKKNTK